MVSSRDTDYSACRQPAVTEWIERPLFKLEKIFPTTSISRIQICGLRDADGVIAVPPSRIIGLLANHEGPSCSRLGVGRQRAMKITFSRQ